MRELTTGSIVYVEYNGVGRPFQVYTDELTGFDFFKKDGYISCDWCSQNIKPFLNALADPEKWKISKKLKLWFKEEYRPTSNTGENDHILTDQEISDMGYMIIKEPKYLEEIVEAIENY